ncbi:MAG: peptidase M15A [Candidatus Sericytochromatia bacterium]|nr:peptidase M15A [Candidatus Sericytochromatia bacterium]
MSVYLSPNFTLQELIVSQTAARQGLRNLPGPGERVNLERLAKTVLQPLRDHVGRPVVITSGYRSLAVNRAVGGSSGSAHMSGLAADLHIPGMSVRQVMHTIKGLQLPFDQMIDEFGSWVHVGLSTGRNRHQILNARFVNGRAHYTELKL